ncbi:hypothetical protein TUMEXPCC7403_01570 [Tumidithrix helvetica PCC 7403]|uniref:hypothetical protein n=1 Tax=Tumidithrix helvetica TaxID=3457545 RepID=UPI003C8F7565
MTSTRARNSRLMIVVLPNETAAFEAYRFLQSHGISPENLALVGKGYSSPDSVGLIEPKRMAWRYAKFGMIILAAATAFIGIGIQLAINIHIPELNWFQSLVAVAIASGIVGGLLGILVGSIYGLFFKSSTSIACRNCLRQGQYLLMLEGSETLTRRGREILNSYSANPR